MNLLKIILDRSKVEYDHICADLQLTKDELEKRLTEAQWQSFKQKVEKKLIPIQNNIKERKRDTFMRDKLDYELDRVLSWKNTQKNKRTFRNNRN